METESLATWRENQANDPEAQQYQSKEEKVTSGLETFNKAAAVLSGYDQLWGLAPGTLSAQYAAGIAGGGYAPDDIYGILKDEGFSDDEIRPRTDEDKAAPVTWYLKWATENGVTPGDDVSRYVAEDDRRYYGQRVADINAGIYSDPDPTEETQTVASNAPLGSDEPYVATPKESWYSGIGNALGAAADAIGSLFGGRTAETTTKEAYVVPAAPSEPGASGVDPRTMTTDYTGQKLVDLAQQYIGVPYEHNFPDAKDDPSTTGWDCSSFIHWLADNAGISEEQYPNDPGYVGGGVPVGSHFQWQWAEANDLVVGDTWQDAQPGDAIYFSTDPDRNWCDPANYNGCMNNDASHVALYLGPDPDTGRPLMMHAAAPEVGTVYDYLDTYPYPIMGVVRWMPQQTA
jgi:cell wall-associated NlpC family hydrolase